MIFRKEIGERLEAEAERNKKIPKRSKSNENQDQNVSAVEFQSTIDEESRSRWRYRGIFPGRTGGTPESPCQSTQRIPS